MRILGKRLRDEEVIERIAMMNRQSGRRDQMGIRNFEALKPLIREDGKNLLNVCVELADSQLHGDFP